MRAVHLRISGRVQGVGYRAWAMRAAGHLGIRGWVRNRADGTVEVLVIGDEPAITAMIAACRQGPPASIVADVSVAEAADDGSPGFAERLTI
jgi:acylphosphatase